MAQELEPVVTAALEPGDILMRRGHFRILGGLIRYSDLLCHLCDSPFSHAGLAYERVGDDFLVLDIGPYGIQRRYLVDFLIEGPENVVVLRLRPEFRDRLPRVMAMARQLVENDVLHDFPYGSSEEDFYCAELVDHVYREAGLPLADKVPIRELPNVRRWYQEWFYQVVAWIVGADMSAPIAVTGNREYGMYASPYLMEVLNLMESAE